MKLVSWTFFIPTTCKQYVFDTHYIDAIMAAMASQITSLLIVYSTIYSGTDQRKYQSSALWGEFTSDQWIPHTRASNTGNVSIWWRHHVYAIPYSTYDFVVVVADMKYVTTSESNIMLYSIIDEWIKYIYSFCSNFRLWSVLQKT